MCTFSLPFDCTVHQDQNPNRDSCINCKWRTDSCARFLPQAGTHIVPIWVSTGLNAQTQLPCMISEYSSHLHGDQNMDSTCACGVLLPFLLVMTGKQPDKLAFACSGLYDPLFTPAVAKHNIGVFLARQPNFTGKITLRIFRGGHTSGNPTELEDSIKWCGWLQAVMRSFTQGHGLSVIMYDGLFPAPQVV